MLQRFWNSWQGDNSHAGDVLDDMIYNKFWIFPFLRFLPSVKSTSREELARMTFTEPSVAELSVLRHVLRCSLDWPARVHVSRPRVKSALALVETYRFVERYVPECSDDTLQRRWRRPPGDYCCWLSCLEQKGLELKLA